MYQAGMLRQLRDFAVARSPFYAKLHRGLERRPLHELPTVTKSSLMDDFDQVVSDRSLRRAAVDEHVSKHAGELLLDHTA